LKHRGRNPDYDWREAARGFNQTRNHDIGISRLQQRSRLKEVNSEGLECWETPVGTYWTPGGCGIYNLAFILAEIELQFYTTKEHQIHPGDTVIDCGANVGLFSRFALQSGAQRVVVVEPAPLTRAALRRNLAPFIAEGRVLVCEKGVWSEEKTLTLQVSAYNPGTSSFVVPVSDGVPKHETEVTTIDAIVAEFGLDRVDFIKMDVEGAETEAVIGSRNTLSRHRPRLSIATEHTTDVAANARRVAQLVREAWSGYRTELAVCGFIDGMIRPEVLRFR
jgi:FkbM family methyltransferase